MQLKSLEETRKFSENFSKKIGPGDIIFLYGEIGVGKTTFTRFFINQLERKKKVKESEVLSPTFNIVYDYDLRNLKILHYDLFRLKNNKDISQLGIFDTSKNSIKIIEWPELIKDKPFDRIEINFKYVKSKNSRTVKISGFGKWKKHEFFKI